MKRFAALVVTLALAVLGALAGAGPAAGHSQLVSSEPAEGAQLDTAPRQVKLTFSEPVQDADVNQVAVTGPHGGQWTAGPAQVKGNVVTAPLRPLGPAGKYVIGYRVLSADGHPVSKEIPFTLTTPGSGTAAPNTGTPGSAKASAPQAEQPANPDSGVPVWVWIVGAAVLLIIGVMVALRMGRSHEE